MRAASSSIPPRLPPSATGSSAHKIAVHATSVLHTRDDPVCGRRRPRALRSEDHDDSKYGDDGDNNGDDSDARSIATVAP